jgi:hypothetical protein
LWNIILNQTLRQCKCFKYICGGYIWLYMTIYDCIYISDLVWYQCLCRGLCRCLFRGLWNYPWLCSYYKVCTVYQKNTVRNIAVTPLLSAWRPKNHIRLKPWLYISPDDARPEAENCVLYYLPTSYPTELQGFLIIKYDELFNYYKSIFKDKPSIV